MVSLDVDKIQAIEEMRQEVEEIAKNWNTDYVEH